MLKKVLTFWLGFLFITGIHANSLTREDIHRLAESYVLEIIPESEHYRVETKAFGLDSLTRFKACQAPIEFAKPNNFLEQQRVTIKLECFEPRWKTHVTVRVQRFGKVAVFTRSMRRGDVITPDDIKLVEYDLNQLFHGYYFNPKEIIGLVPIRTLPAGNIVNPKYVRLPDIVKRSQSVKIIYEKKNIQISSRGIALEKGALGDVIRVQNANSKKILDAEVISASTVKIKNF